MSDIIPSNTPSTKPDDELDLGSLDDLDELAVAAESAESNRRRFALVMDATGSMSDYWDMAKSALIKILEEINARTYVPFQVNIVAYRDKTCDSDWIEYSGWSNDMDYLKSFSQGIHCGGGGDFPESVDCGLSHIIPDGPNKVILIGDAPGRPESPGWTEATKLGQSQCPIFPLYVGNIIETKEHFEQLAKLSGGKAFPLRSAHTMADIVAVIIASDKTLAITYQATTIEGKRIQDELEGR